jgi:hypothetical protein
MVVTNFGIGTASPMIEILVGIFGSFGADGIGGKERFDRAEKSGIWGIVGNCGVTLPCIAFCIPELIVPDRLLEALGANPLIAGKLLEILAGIAFMLGRFFKASVGTAFAIDDSFTPPGNAFSVMLEALAGIALMSGRFFKTSAGTAFASDDSFAPAGNDGNALSVKVRAEAQMLTKTSEIARSTAPNKLFMVILKRMVLVWKKKRCMIVAESN